MSAENSPPSPPTRRIVSLDEFRGYTVVGMLLVNFVGGFAVIPAILKHHNTYCSYADTIMPQFFFAVGFAYRLTFLRRRDREGPSAAIGHVVRRSLGLILIGLVVYHLDGGAKTWSELKELGFLGFLTTAFQRDPFQTLVHIGVTSLWVLPVIGRGPLIQAAFAVISGLIHVFVSRSGYYEFAWMRPVIDGGPLGFLTWTIPLIAGSLAHDLMARLGPSRALAPMLAVGIALMGIGYGLNCLGADGPAAPPFVAPPAIAHPSKDAEKNGPGNIWEMSQRAGTASYLTFAAGVSVVLYAFFVIACDLGSLRVGAFRTFGTNALAAYVLHPMVFELVKPYVPRDAPLWYVAASTALAMWICYVLVRALEKQGVLIRL